MLNIRLASSMVSGVAGELLAAEAQTHHLRSTCSTSVSTLSSLESELESLLSKTHAIDGVTNQISSLALDTRILSLNATIEAAHAGEAGAGFAVVANAVRDLSRETAKATSTIFDHLQAVLSAVDRVQKVHEQLREQMLELDRESGVLAVRVKEQGEIVSTAVRFVDEAIDAATTPCAQAQNAPPASDTYALAPADDDYALAPADDDYGLAPVGDDYGLAPVDDDYGLAPVDEDDPYALASDEADEPPDSESMDDPYALEAV
ncbi:MAG: hypothetical protein KC619_15600 [Myxococcales bacterium]|nr:hypothetical protein [Myxococcales bacterium]